MQCNAGKRGKKKGRERERGREGARRRDGLGRSSRANRHGVLYPQISSSPGTRLGAICRFFQYGICDPTYSPFSLSPSHLAQIEIHSFLATPSQLNFLFSFSFHILSAAYSPRSLPFSSALAPPILRIATLFSRYLFPYHILAPFLLTNPTCMRLFPHVVLIIYTFSNSRLFFFLSPSDQTGEAFILTPYPLICAAMRPAIPRMLHPITFVYPFRA